MSVNKYVNGKLLQVSGNADTRLTLDDISTILGYTPVNPNIIGTELATLNSSGKLEDGQKPSYSWSEITGKPSTFTPSSHTHSYAGSSSAGGAATSALTLTTARTLTIGNSGKTFDGSTDVSWSLSEIGAASQSDLDILNSNKISYSETEITILDVYSNLNDYTTPKIYRTYVMSDASKDFKNCPITCKFVLLVQKFHTTTYQTIYPMDISENTHIYKRSLFENIWSDWIVVN